MLKKKKRGAGREQKKSFMRWGPHRLLSWGEEEVAFQKQEPEKMLQRGGGEPTCIRGKGWRQTLALVVSLKVPA
jgi:hypothetical protein